MTADAILWTKFGEENYLAQDAIGDVYEWLEVQVQQLDELVALTHESLSDLRRRCLVSLITQNVHFRDITEGIINAEVFSASDFKWQQVLRFYFVVPDCYARQNSIKLNYGYEYLGSTSRLVVTPLTDRCWITITTALGLALGAAPQGPAGTGKTESVKDLAKNLAMYCVVYNCSEQMNVKVLEKLFAGLCYTGSWGCLD